MEHEQVTLEHILPQAMQLGMLDKLRLIERMAAIVQREVAGAAPGSTRSLRGLWKDLGPAPSADEIDEARREAWGTPKRDDSS